MTTSMSDALARIAATQQPDDDTDDLYRPDPPTEDERAHRRALAAEARRQLDAARLRLEDDHR